MHSGASNKNKISMVTVTVFRKVVLTVLGSRPITDPTTNRKTTGLTSLTTAHLKATPDSRTTQDKAAGTNSSSTRTIKNSSESSVASNQAASLISKSGDKESQPSLLTY